MRSSCSPTHPPSAALPSGVAGQAAGLKIGARGGIWVDEHMRTSDECIYAVGDAVEVKDFVTGG